LLSVGGGEGETRERDVLQNLSLLQENFVGFI
jgi:hypothetical protein